MVIVTIILVILTTLFLGTMANQDPVVQLEGFGPEDAEKAECESRNYKLRAVLKLILCQSGDRVSDPQPSMVSSEPPSPA